MAMQIGPPYTVITRMRRLKNGHSLIKYTQKQISKLTSQVEGFLLDNYPSKNLLSKDQSQTSNTATKMTFSLPPFLSSSSLLYLLYLIMSSQSCCSSVSSPSVPDLSKSNCSQTCVKWSPVALHRLII